MQTVRIVIISLGVGGTERHLLQILPELQKRNIKIRLLALSKHNLDLKAEFVKQGVEVILPEYENTDGKPVCLFKAFWFLVKDFKQHKKQVTHFFLPASYAIGMLAAIFSQTKAPLVMSRRSLNLYQKKYFGFATLERFLHKKTKYICANSRAIMTQLRKEGVKNKKIQLIYNGVDTVKFIKAKNKQEKLAIREKLKIDKNAIVFIIVANLIPYKGHSDLFKALQVIDKNVEKKWLLICVGRDDGIKEELQKLAGELGLSKHIRMEGLKENVELYYKAADIAISASKEEGFSNAILEAMSCSLPVVATDVGGNSEAVIDGKTGIIVPKDNITQLGTTLLALIIHKAKRKEFGKNGRKRIEEKFSFAACAEKYETLYKSLQKHH